MKYCLSLLATSLILISCKNKPSEDHLSPKVMKKLLMDIHIAETYSTFKKDSLHKAGGKNIDSLSIYYKDVLNHYNITPAQFSTSITWYEEHPDELDSIYNEMIPVATGMQSKVPALPAGANTPIELPGKR